MNTLSAKKTPVIAWNLLVTEFWILLSAGLVAGGWWLSMIGFLNAQGYLLLLVFLLVGTAFWLRRRKIRPVGVGLKRWRKRLCQPFSLLFFILLLAEAIGGLLYAPTNYDGLTYRLPRVLHWLAEHRWHWIGGWNARMDYSAVGYEWFMAPLVALTHGDRLLFLPNLLSYALLPGLIFTTFRELGVGGQVARYWMWILPCGYSLVLQTGSIGNDSFAMVFLFAALAFSRRAARNHSWRDALLALLAMSLLTGAKASNLPLLLPCLLTFLPVIPQLARYQCTSGKLTGTALVGLLSLTVSFLPLAMINWQKTGDWTGDPLNEGKMKLDSPFYGLAGNTLQLVVENLEPPILPDAARVNESLHALMQSALLQKITAHFPRCSLAVNDLVGEEAAGIGLGITLLGGVLYSGTLRHVRRFSAIWKSAAAGHLGILVGLSAWIALIAFMVKLGSEAVPRIATPYYPLLLILPSLHPIATRLLRKKSWQVFSFLAAASVLPAVILSPARPLFPVEAAVTALARHSPSNSILQRVQTVYAVYARRSDPYVEVRNQLPAGARVIGFAGTGDESEVSFWRPFGQHSVHDLLPIGSNRLPDVRGVDVIVTSDWGCNDRFGRTPEQLAADLGWKVSNNIPVQSRASAAPRIWNILLPP